ncbi:MAG TPA: MerR family transcriptional regulator [Spirochaetia bacterium]|nr:MerR family transcriptional regulator [Spirochaetia bacterium]
MSANAEDERLYRIGIFARKARVSVRTVRFYDLEGLLVSRRRSLAGFRLYDWRDFERLRRILALKALGLPLAEIRRILDTETADLSGILDRQSQELGGRIQVLQGVVDAIRQVQIAATSHAVDWNLILRVAAAIGRESIPMNEFTLGEDRYREASLSVLYPRGRKTVWARLAPALPVIVAVGLVAVQVALRQYVGAAVLAGGFLFLTIATLLVTRGRRGTVQARATRLSTVPYRIRVLETGLELEYDKSSFHMPFENLHIGRRNPRFYHVTHELGLMTYIPAASIGESEREILDRHVTTGPIDWKAKVASSGTS